MFFRADNRAAVFIDYEYWYVSMKDRYRVRPDLDTQRPQGSGLGWSGGA